MFEPIRGGTRGGQAEFKWSDVSADKDRENYLGHSINAPTGRWQKNKDVHWYSRDSKQGDAERDEEIRKIKEAEAEAMSIALGFGPSKKSTSDPSAPASGANAISVPTGSTASVEPDEDTNARKAEKRQRKEERRLEKQARKEQRRAEKLAKRDYERDMDDNPRGHHSVRVGGRDDKRRDHSRSRSPRRREAYPDDERDTNRDYSHRRRHSGSRSPRRSSDLRCGGGYRDHRW